MTPLKIPELANHSWKPCHICNGEGEHPHHIEWDVEVECKKCGGTGNEPVAVENPIICRCMCHNPECRDISPDYCYCSGEKCRQLQVGVPFDVLNCECSNHQEGDFCYNSCPCGEWCYLKFLPLYPKVKGDNSVMMVVRCG